MSKIEPQEPGVRSEGAPSSRRFADLPLSPDTLRGVADLGYATLTELQASVIEPALAGRDLLVCAGAGSGKIAAFAVPIVERAEASARRPLALVLAPTQESAQRISETLSTIARYRAVNLCLLVDGLAFGPQEELLRYGCELLVGTPIRVLEHIQRGHLSLSSLQTLCIDEASALSGADREAVAAILAQLPEKRQSMLFSAALSEDVLQLASAALTDPEPHAEGPRPAQAPHVLYELDHELPSVQDLLCLIDIEDPPSAIVFCDSRDEAAAVATFLDQQGIDVQLLSGELPVGLRASVERRIRSGEVRILVSTDLGARGVDLSDLSHVIHYRLPREANVYLQRIPRARHRAKPRAVLSLGGPSDRASVEAIGARNGITFVIRPLPDATTATSRRIERQARQMRDAMGSLVSESYLPTVQALKQRPDGDALIAAALRTFFQWDRRRRAAMSEVETAGEGARRERFERKGKRDRKEKERPERKGKERRPRQKGAREEQDPLATDAPELAEDLADSDLSPLDAQKALGGEDTSRKKKRRRRKKGKPDGDLASDRSADDSDSDSLSAPADIESLDDLDALLSTE